MEMWTQVHALIPEVAAATATYVPAEGGGSLLVALMKYPLIAVMPCFFFFLAIRGKKAGLLDVLTAAVIVGPVFSAIAGSLPLLASAGMNAPLVAIAAAGVLSAVAAIFRRGLPALPKADKSWPAPALFSILVVSFLVYIVSHNFMVRISVHGLYHSAVAYRIMQMGLPAEDPLFPGGPIHNYWFYHVWGAILSRFMVRPPADSYTFINIHSLLSTIAGTWMLSVLLFDKARIRLIALFIAVLGMNSLGPLYLLINGLLHRIQLASGYAPYQLLSYTVLQGDYRLPNFLDKFVHINGFPLGVCLYTASFLYAATIFRKGLDPVWVASLFLSALGVFLFHPTSGLGVVAGIGTGFFLTAVYCRGVGKVSVWITAAAAVGSIISIPYLFSVFPPGQGKHFLTLSARNVWNTVSTYILLLPLIIRGTINFVKMRRDDSVFINGYFFGTLAVALLVWLPGDNQYKFIQLLSIPAGMISAAAFLESGSTKLKNILLSMVLVLAMINIGIMAYAYTTSDWWRTEKYTARGISLYPLDDKERNFFEWIITSTPDDAVLATIIEPMETAAFSQRSIICPGQYWVSMGHAGAAERGRMVKRLFGQGKVLPEDLALLRGLKRPIFVVVWPDFKGYNAIVKKLNGMAGTFEQVYDRDGYRLYRLKEK